MIKITNTVSDYALKLFVGSIMLLPTSVLAHTPICDCYDNGDNTITCEGGFSDGASAAGVPMRVVDMSGKVLILGEMSEYSDYTFEKPECDFRVIYEGGDGHIIEIDGRDIEE